MTRFRIRTFNNAVDFNAMEPQCVPPAIFKAFTQKARLIEAKPHHLN